LARAEAGGYLVPTRPNIDIIGSDDIVEEWFIDKHVYHFLRGRCRDGRIGRLHDRRTTILATGKILSSLPGKPAAPSLFVDSDIAEVEKTRKR